MSWEERYLFNVFICLVLSNLSSKDWNPALHSTVYTLVNIDFALGEKPHWDMLDGESKHYCVQSGAGGGGMRKNEREKRREKWNGMSKDTQEAHVTSGNRVHICSVPVQHLFYKQPPSRGFVCGQNPKEGKEETRKGNTAGTLTPLLSIFRGVQVVKLSLQ